MKRYLVFRGFHYYPEGGWDDFIGSFESLDEAKQVANKNIQAYEWVDIIDTTTMEKVNET